MILYHILNGNLTLLNISNMLKWFFDCFREKESEMMEKRIYNSFDYKSSMEPFKTSINLIDILDSNLKITTNVFSPPWKKPQRTKNSFHPSSCNRPSGTKHQPSFLFHWHFKTSCSKYEKYLLAAKINYTTKYFCQSWCFVPESEFDNINISTQICIKSTSVM